MQSGTAVWNRIGETRRAWLKELTASNPNLTAPNHYLPLVRNLLDVGVETSVEKMTCTADALERTSECGCDGCAGRTFLLQSKIALRALLQSQQHATSFVLRFLDSPHLAFPIDIPEFTEKCLQALEDREKLLKMAEAKKAEKAARKQASWTRKRAQEQARIDLRQSYPYRIEQAEKQVEKYEDAVRTAQNVLKRAQKRLRYAIQSVNSLRRAQREKESEQS